MTWTIPWNIIAQQVAGDFGDLTVYTDRHQRKVWYPRAPPKEPPTDRQMHQRHLFTLAQRSWAALTPQEKKDLEDMCRRTSASLTGQNLWMSCHIKGDWSTLETISRQAGIPITHP